MEKLDQALSQRRSEEHSIHVPAGAFHGTFHYECRPASASMKSHDVPGKVPFPAVWVPLAGAA